MYAVCTPYAVLQLCVRSGFQRVAAAGLLLLLGWGKTAEENAIHRRGFVFCCCVSVAIANPSAILAPFEQPFPPSALARLSCPSLGPSILPPYQAVPKHICYQQTFRRGVQAQPSEALSSGIESWKRNIIKKQGWRRASGREKRTAHNRMA
ncbi:hypothetical protein B0T20DRAFT_5043 [Sordaria brevicollis]|uniref:Uncharacterized protein n=1 Tax=Sordaria brevicollis TaxID=83679 RepID=A0AAE0PMH5_SORBR|nr:hypothetical protein B0T20DRAFT_5043 [Sordaria brevicollis]